MEATETTDSSRSSAWRWIVPLAITAVGIGTLVYFLAPYHKDIKIAVDRASIIELLEITALSLIALPLRTEIWRTCLAAAERRPPRSDLHVANGGSFLVSLANHFVAPAAKMWLLRRMQGERAAFLLQLVAIDLSTTVIEGFLAGALVIVAAFQVSLPWWIPVLLLAGASGLLVGALLARRRFPGHPVLEGFSVLIRGRYLGRVLWLLVLVFGVQIVRTWLALRTVGLHVDLGDAMLVFVLTGVLGVLPTGITAAPTAASLLVLGNHHRVARAAASGILVTGSLVIATVIYCLLALAIRSFVVSRRGRSMPLPGAVDSAP